MSEKRAAETAWTRLASETAPPPNAVIELAKFPIQCGEQMPWLAIGMNLDGFNLKEVFLGATHWRLAPQRRHELTVGVPADEITRLTARIAELEKALTWQPIDTAPKDGTWIMGWASGDLNPSRISWGRNHRNNLSWCTAFCSFVEGYITHWTPLPRTTLEASERGGGE